MDQTVDQFPTRRPPTKSINHSTRNNNNNICSTKQTNDETIRTKYQPTNRSISLPSRTFEKKIRRRHASDSNNNRTTLLVTSFIQYLRCELRAKSNDQKHDQLNILEKKSSENIDNLSETFHFSTNFYRQQYPIVMNSSTSSSDINLNQFSHETSDDNEISKLINLLILRVELLAKENILTKKKKTSPIIKQIDQNLIEYLYFLFNKFTKDDAENSSSMIDKTNFVHVCQTLVRNGCFHPPTSNSEITIPDTNPNQSSLTVHEYRSDIDDILQEKSLYNDHETWLVVDLEPIEPRYSASTPDQSKYLLPPSSTASSDDPFICPNEAYFSFEELKSCESESSQSNYYSPNSSLVDLQTMVQELDEINNNNNNNNTLFNEDHSTTTSHHSSNESFDPSCQFGLINTDNEQQSETLTKTSNEKISRKEKKIQERWAKTESTNNKNNQEQMSTKTFLGVEFPPIAVLRRKFSSLPPSPPILNPPAIKKKSKTFNYPSKSTSSNQPLFNQEINTSIVDKTQHDQVFNRQLNDISSLNESKNNDIEQAIPNVTIFLNEEKPMTNFGIKKDSSFSPSSSSSSSHSSSIQTTNDDENQTNEVLLKEIEEEKKEKEEEHMNDDVIDEEEEKKNNCNNQPSRTLLPNGEPTEIVVLEKEKEQETEQAKSSSLTFSQKSGKHLEKEDDSSLEYVLNHLQTMTTNEDIYKTIEIEEIPDEDEDLSIQNNSSIEPIDCILTDDELKLSRQTPPRKESQKPPVPKRPQRPEDDPIAQRALERFEQRMHAASVAKTNKEESNSSITKGKSSWSGTSTSTWKSVENLLKLNQPSSSSSNCEDSSITQRDSFIRPRKTMLDDFGLNIFATSNLSYSEDNHVEQKKLEEQIPPKAIVEDDNKQIDSNVVIGNLIDFEDYPEKTEEEEKKPQVQIMSVNSSLTNESNNSTNEEENVNSLAESSSTNASSNTVTSPSSTDQQNLTPYRLQLEGRRRLNTLERIRERQQNSQANDLLTTRPPPVPTQIQLQNEYVVKPEDLQDPIVRRALERFDEKSRSLSQTRPNQYEDIQDPITRRALMRLETNLKRTIPSNPSASINNDSSNETWYTNNYTLGSLQSNVDPRLLHYPDSTLTNLKPTHVSIHQRFCSTLSSDMSELTMKNSEHDIPTMRVPTQPIYVTTNNHQQTPTINLRQRSRSEDMLSSRELSLGQTTNLDESDEPSLQQNQSMEELQQQQQQDINNNSHLSIDQIEVPLSNTIIKPIDPNFVRTTEASVNYATPTQVYTAYSCEYARPHRNQLITQSKSEIMSPRNFQHENDIQSSSAFTPVHPSTNNNYYHPQLPSSSNSTYNSMYTTNNPHQVPYSDDPIVRRALERFNCQMQNSLMNLSQHSTMINRQMHNGYPSQDPHQYDALMNSARSPPGPPTTSTGYQSIIGRRRQLRHDDSYHDHTSVGNGYSSSLFLNSQNSYPYPDETPVFAPRLHRDMYHEQQEYLSENMNNNNNNPHLYGYSNGFHPIHPQYVPSEYFQQYQEEEFLRHRAQSTSSTTSSDSINHIRLMQQRLPPTSTRINYQQNKNLSPENSQIPSGQTTPSTSDSVFQRLAYTNTKSSLSKSSSNLCANLSNRLSQQQQQQQQTQTKLTTNFKSEEIDYEESNVPNDSTSESLSTMTKCQRSRSVDGRARLKNAQNRLNNVQRSTTNDDDETSTVPSSKFTPVSTTRRENAPPPRVPISSRSIITDRTTSIKRVPNGSHTKYNQTGRVRGSNGNLIDTDNDEHLSSNDNYQPKIIETKPRTSIPVHRYPTNHIQTSASASSVNSTRAKVPLPTTSTNLERKDSNISGTDLNKSSNRVLSPNGQRRTIPVSVFAPAKLESKRSTSSISSPTSTSPVNGSYSIEQIDYQQEQEKSSLSTINTLVDHNQRLTIEHENELNTKLSTSNTSLKSSTGNLLNELSFTNDKHENGKKMNVFERLFRGHKKKV